VQNYEEKLKEPGMITLEKRRLQLDMVTGHDSVEISQWSNKAAKSNTNTKTGNWTEKPHQTAKKSEGQKQLLQCPRSGQVEVELCPTRK
jgi:hypothetical protein